MTEAAKGRTNLGVGLELLRMMMLSAAAPALAGSKKRVRVVESPGSSERPLKSAALSRENPRVPSVRSVSFKLPERMMSLGLQLEPPEAKVPQLPSFRPATATLM